MPRISRSETVQPKSLVEMTMKTIIQNIHSYGKKLDKLEPELRQMVLKHLLKKYYTGCERNISDKAWLAYPRLLSRKTKEIDTSGFKTLFEHYDVSKWNSEFPFVKVLKKLAGNAPKLQKLIINHSTQRDCLLGRKEIATLSYLKNLLRLHISKSIVLLSELKEIAKKCKGLQFIKVSKLELDGEKKVDFFDDGFLHHEIRFGSRDITIRLDKDVPRTEHHLVGPGPHYHFIGYPKKVENLEFLATQPHATALTISCEYFWDELNVGRFPRLPNLRSAKFLGSYNRTQAVECFLEENGSHLSLLEISRRATTHCSVTAELTLEKIFGLCNNLEWFSLNNLTLSSYNAPVGCLNHLKWFKIFNASGMRVNISSLLSAPQLQDFVIKIRSLDLGNKETLFSRIAQNEILTNLRRFNIYTYPKPNEDSTDLLEDQLTAVIESAMADDVN